MRHTVLYQITELLWKKTLQKFFPLIKVKNKQLHGMKIYIHLTIMLLTGRDTQVIP